MSQPGPVPAVGSPGLPPFLDPDVIALSCREAGLSDEVARPLLDLAHRTALDPERRRLAAAVHHCVYETRGDYAEAARQADAAFGPESGVLHALLVLDSIRLVREKQSARGVAAEISQAVNARHGIPWLRGAVERHGQAVLEDWGPGWFRTVGSGHLYRLGRLEFFPEDWAYPFRVYASARTDEVVMLADSGQRFSGEGYRVGEPAWTTSLIETGDAVVGTPISPRGFALNRRVRLPLDEWCLALGPGDRVLDLHIPAEGALTLEALRDAFEQAEPFFDRYYADRPFVAYIGDSWLYSTQLEAMLPPESNLLRWQREGYLFPSDSVQEDFLPFVFGSARIDLASAPRDTRLRRAVIGHLERGEVLRCGAYLMLRSDLGRFGSQHYRQASDRAIARLAVP